MELDYRLIGERIRIFRMRNGYTQAQLAERVGLSDVYIRYIESARRTAKLDTYVSILNALGHTMDELLSGFQVHDSLRIPISSDIMELLQDCTEAEVDIIVGFISAMKISVRSL